MRRNFLRGLIICLVPTLLAAGFIGWAANEEATGPQRSVEREAAQQRLNEAADKLAGLRREESAAGDQWPAEKKAELKQAEAEEQAAREALQPGGWKPQFRRGIDLAGGTILIYEVKSGELREDEIKELADKLKRRIDPNDLKNVIVRPLGRSRIEIILPFVGGSGGKEKANEEFVEDVRQKVKQQGVLEFRIVANPSDDGPGLADAIKDIEDPSKKDARDAKARAGEPPDAPTTQYDVKAAGTDAEKRLVRYEWVELGLEERESLGLSQQYESEGKVFRRRDGSSQTGTMFQDVKRAREAGKVYQDGRQVLYSREFIKRPPNKDEADKKVEYFMLTRVSDGDSLRVVNMKLRADYLTNAGNNEGPGVSFQFVVGGERLRELTRLNKPTGDFKRQMAVIMDGKVVSAPSLNSELPGGGQISGNFDAKSAEQLVAILRSGDLNAGLKPDPVSENTIGATLGETTIRNGLLAVAGAFVVVLLFMVVYYRFAGLVACVALFVNLLLTVGFMVAMNAAFTLPGLAGIVLMLGMAVDANVLIYERLREEREKGATLAAAIRNGYDRAFLTIIDTHLTSIFTSVVLYTFGNDALKGFSVSLTVGLIISLFTSLYITRLMFDFWLHKKWLTQLKMLRLFSQQKIDFMKLRNTMIVITGVLTVVGLGLFLWRGERVLNVDFTQGTAYGGRLAAGKEKSLTEMLDLLSEDNQKKRLAVTDVTRNTQAVNANIYDVEYADGSRTQVSLANLPEGADEKAQLANLKARLSHLPDHSVEQVFLKDDKFDGGRSRSFTIRTTEKEKEIVQVALDRLLRGGPEGKDPLVDGYKVKVGAVSDGGSVTVTFDPPAGVEDGVSRNYFKDFVVRALKTSPLAEEADAVEVVGVPTPVPTAPASGSEADKQAFEAAKAKAAREGQTQRYATMTVSFDKLPTLKGQLVAADKAAGAKAFIAEQLNKAKDTFEARPVPERLETFDPSLAKDTRGKAFGAILISWVVILAYLWFRFGSWRHGLAAVLCLVHDLCFTLGAIAVCHYLHDTAVGRLLGLKDFKIDLAAVAALLTLVGYSVNEIIVNFARLREVRGKNPVLTPQMINLSVNQTLSRTILTSTTVALVSFVLYAFGGEGVHLFAFVMLTGVLISTYSSIYVASPLLLIFGEGKPKAGLPGGGGGPAGDGPGGEKLPEAASASAIAS